MNSYGDVARIESGELNRASKFQEDQQDKKYKTFKATVALLRDQPSDSEPIEPG